MTNLFPSQDSFSGSIEICTEGENLPGKRFLNSLGIKVVQGDSTVQFGTVEQGRRNPLCSPNHTTLCLLQDRFRVTVDWDDGSNSGQGQAMPLGNGSGFFYFSDPENIDLFIQVINGCFSNGYFWVFSASTTDVEYMMSVSDTKTNQTETYFKPQGTIPDSILDTTTFTACPTEGPWTLTTTDTLITIDIAQSTSPKPVVTLLKSTQFDRNWAKSGFEIPLMSTVWFGGKRHTTEWAYQSAEMNRQSGKLVFTFTNASPRLELRSIWRARPGHGPIEHWVEMDNRSGRTVTLSHQDSLSLSGLHVNEAADVWWVRRGGNNARTEGGIFVESLTSGYDRQLISNCENGSSPVPWVAVQLDSGEGIYVGWEFSGLGRIDVGMSSGGDDVDLHVGNMPDFKTDVYAGETFVIPTAFVGCYVGDVDEGSYTLHRFILEYLRPEVPEGYPDPLLVSNPGIHPGPMEAHVRRISKAACDDLGFETHMLDAWWFLKIGDWRWHPGRFPNGMAPIEERLHTKGLNVGLWYSWTNGGISLSPAALSVRGSYGHPDWFRTWSTWAPGNIEDPDWRPPPPYYGAQACLASSEAREWILNETQRLVSHHNLDYFKSDFGPIINACDRTSHRHGYGVDTV